jgi:hypothetical protein
MTAALTAPADLAILPVSSEGFCILLAACQTGKLHFPDKVEWFMVQWFSRRLLIA